MVAVYARVGRRVAIPYRYWGCVVKTRTPLRQLQITTRHVQGQYPVLPSTTGSQPHVGLRAYPPMAIGPRRAKRAVVCVLLALGPACACAVSLSPHSPCGMLHIKIRRMK